MASESPFLLQRVECPVCKTINEFEQIKVGAYQEGGRDTDFCPSDITWRFPKYQAYNPLVYFTATCSHCYYTREFSPKYRDWKSDNAFRTFQLKPIKIKHLEQLSTADSLVRKLGEAIDYQRWPNESAILKLHLAIFDLQQADHSSALDLGRYYLRIGWVFRTLGKGENPSNAVASGIIRQISEKHDLLVDKLTDAQGASKDLAAAIQIDMKSGQLPAELQSHLLKFRDECESGLAELQKAVTNAQAHEANFREKLTGLKAVASGGQSGEDTEGMPEGEQSLIALLSLAQAQWSGVVTSEQEALEQAIRYYKEAYAGGREIAPGNQQIQASYLIAELSRRIGDYDGAKQFFTSTIKTGQEFVYKNRRDQSRTVLARKILELAIEQGRANLEASKSV